MLALLRFTPILPAVFFVTASFVHSQEVAHVSPKIISAWKLNGGDVLLIFRYDGTYIQVQKPGMERGNFVWDQETQEFTATAIIDTNGKSGLSHPEGETNLSISGNTLTYNVAGENSATFSRVVSTASAIVGSWFIPGDNTTVTFLSDGTYFSTEEENDAPYGHDGYEQGTYTWNSGTGALTATATIDTNGDTGLGGLPPGFSATVSGNTLTVSDAEETTELRRVNARSTPLDEPEFYVEKLAELWQFSEAAPIPVTTDPEDGLYPYNGGAGVSASVGADAPTLKIGANSAFPIPEGEDEDEYETETGFTGLTQLNNAFPNGVDYKFTSVSGSAILAFPAGTQFPAAPRIIGEDGVWEDEIYTLPANDILEWTPFATYDSATDFLVIDVEDAETQDQIIDELLQSDLASYDFSGKLEPGRIYQISISRLKLTGAATSASGVFAGKVGYSISESLTEFFIQTQPEDENSPEIYEQPLSRAADPGENVILSIAVAETYPKPTFQWFKDDTLLTGQTGNSLALLDVTTDDFGSYQVRVTADDQTVTSDLAVVGETFTAYVTRNGLNPLTTGAANADADKDGIANLLEYVLGGNPVTPSHGLLPTFSSSPIPGGQNLVFQYNRKLVASGISQAIEYSANLVPPWTPVVDGANGADVDTTPVDSTTEKVTITLPASGGKGFIRLKAAK